jgi:hypothetical protein
MTMEDFGARVNSAWNDLRSTTRNLLERAWQSPATGPTAQPVRSTHYDPRADRELTRLLSALDERTREAIGDESTQKARRLAETCASVLMEQTQSAEVFSQLIQRAHSHNDFARIDAIADALSKRLGLSEICELARSNPAVVRALGQEALMQVPARALSQLLRDPVDAEVARDALHRQAGEYNSKEAQKALQEFEEFGFEDF